MASAAVSHDSSPQPFEFGTSDESLVDSSNLEALPSKFDLETNTNETSVSSFDSLPTVDFSALTASADTDRRSKAVAELAKACADWGFFVLENHGMPEAAIDTLFPTMREFFSLGEDEKKQYEPENPISPITYGSVNDKSTSNHSFDSWREFLVLYAHPDFHCPTKPQRLREILKEYTKRIRVMTRELMGALSESMNMEKGYVEEALKLDMSFQIIGTNLYSPCPQPDQTIGLPPHNDPGLLTILLVHKGIAGLQIERQGQWFEVNSPTYSMIVIVGDHLEIFSNGRCKSLKHKAVMNKESERISIAVANGPGKDAVVGPAAPLVEKDGGALYRSMMFQEYIKSRVTKYSTCNGRTILEDQMITDIE